MYKKYPRTFHLPWSPGCTSDDKKLSSIEHMKEMTIVVSEKLDGENTSIYRDHIHARSIDSSHHGSRSYVKGLQSRIGHTIPEGWRICGENVFAKHSILYDKLTDFFYVFSVWDDKNNCLSWVDTVKFAEKIGLKTVPVLYMGKWADDIEHFFTGHSRLGGDQEGYVVRNIESFSYDEFSENLAKYVRKDHVQTDKHWKTRWVPNKRRWIFKCGKQSKSI